jgi:hypothetical protein
MTRQSIMRCLVPIFLCFAPVLVAADAQTAVSTALQRLKSVHALREVTMSPDGRHVVYGTVTTGKRDSAAVDVIALFIADAHDGSRVQHLTACPGAVCNEHSVAWSPRWNPDRICDH